MLPMYPGDQILTSPVFQALFYFEANLGRLFLQCLKRLSHVGGLLAKQTKFNLPISATG